MPLLVPGRRKRGAHQASGRGVLRLSTFDDVGREAGQCDGCCQSNCTEPTEDVIFVSREMGFGPNAYGFGT